MKWSWGDYFPEFPSELKTASEGHPQLVEQIVWSRQGDLLYREDQVCIPKHQVPEFLRWVHESRGHIRGQRLVALFQRAVYTTLKNSEILQQLKDSQCHCAKATQNQQADRGLLRPLPIPYTANLLVYVDFIEGLPKFKGYDSILLLTCGLTSPADGAGASCARRAGAPSAGPPPGSPDRPPGAGRSPPPVAGPPSQPSCPVGADSSVSPPQPSPAPAPRPGPVPPPWVPDVYQRVDRPLTPAQQQLCASVWAPGADPEDVLVQAFGVDVGRGDLRTLRPSAWLNDQVIHLYGELITLRCQLGIFRLPRTYVFSTNFYTRLVGGPMGRGSPYDRVRSWTKGGDILTYDVLLLPVHLVDHWALVVVSRRNQQVSYLDSLGRPGHQVLEAVLRYLEDEHGRRRCDPLNWAGWVVGTPRGAVPQQDNEVDCGVFLCKYMSYCALECPFDFGPDHIPAIRGQMVAEILTAHGLPRGPTSVPATSSAADA